MSFKAFEATEKLRLGHFWDKVNRVDATCWEWLGKRNGAGYGVLNVKRRTIRAHRYSLALAGVEVPTDAEVDHLCRNRGCVRPDHLRLVPRGFNILQGSETMFLRAKYRPHCLHGHPWTPENTQYVTLASGKPGRRCKECKNSRRRRGTK